MSGACCNSYDVGDSIKIVAECRNEAGALADPTTLVFRVKAPVAAEATYTFGVDANVTRVTGETVGKFQCRITATEASTATAEWLWRVKATGAVVAADEGYFHVNASRFSSP